MFLVAAFWICIYAITMSVILVLSPVKHTTGELQQPKKALKYEEISAFMDKATAKEPEIENCGIRYEIDEIKRFAPWHAVIYYDETLKEDKSGYKRICGGTLISKKQIISHYQCVKVALDELDRNNRKLIKYHVLLGKTEDDVKTVGEHEQEFIVSEIDSGFITYQTDRDNIIALLITKNEIIYSDFVRPICLSINITRENENMKIGIDGLVSTFNRKKALGKFSQIYALVTYEHCRKLFEIEESGPILKDIFCGSQIIGTDICLSDKGSGYVVREPNKNNEMRYFLRGVLARTKNGAECHTNLQFIHITSRYSRELLLYSKPWYY